MKRSIYHRSGTLVILWILVIFALCATPGQFIPSSSWLDLLSIDKLVHASIFFLLCFLFIVYSLKTSRGKWNLLFILAAAAYGIGLELMQAYCFSNRSMDWKDMVANTFGCITAFFLRNRIESLFRPQRAGA